MMISLEGKLSDGLPKTTMHDAVEAMSSIIDRLAWCVFRGFCCRVWRFSSTELT
jgi:hypothetical protein